MNLARFRTRLAKKLSGGMKQKLGVICGLIHSPEIMLLDEPTTGVDPVSRRELFNVVEEMVSEGLTVLMSTAYMDEAERADRVVMLHEGSLLEAGTVAELRRSSGCAVREITTSNPAAAVDRLRGERWTRFVNPVGATVRHISDSSAEDGLVAGALRGLDAKTARVPPTMEDLFINRLLEREARPAGQG
jgi:ABC-2 type transport system ATP-binding protein